MGLVVMLSYGRDQRMERERKGSCVEYYESFEDIS